VTRVGHVIQRQLLPEGSQLEHVAPPGNVAHDDDSSTQFIEIPFLHLCMLEFGQAHPLAVIGWPDFDCSLEHLSPPPWSLLRRAPTRPGPPASVRRPASPGGTVAGPAGLAGRDSGPAAARAAAEPPSPPAGRLVAARSCAATRTAAGRPRTAPPPACRRPPPP